MLRELEVPASLGVLPYCGAESDASISDPSSPAGPVCWHRSGRSCAGDVSIPPSAVDLLPALHVRNRRLLPAPTPNGFPLQQPRGTSPCLERIPKSLPASSETGLLQASLQINLKCSSCSTGPPDLRPRSNDSDSVALHLAHPSSHQRLEETPHQTAALALQPIPSLLPASSAVPFLPT